MRLAARVARLEASAPPPPVGCDLCRGRTLWFDGQHKSIQAGGIAFTACACCGRVLDGPLSIVGGGLKPEDIV